MKLSVGQKILVDGEKANVLGGLDFSSYSEYLIKMGRRKLWLEAGRDWRLWQKAKHPDLEGAALFLREAILQRFLGSWFKKLGEFNVVEAGTAIVLEAAGETEETEAGEIVVYVEGISPEDGLVCLELWNKDIEFYKGKIVEVTV